MSIDQQTDDILRSASPPFVVLALFPDGVVRVVAKPKDRNIAHEVGQAIADQGYLAWFVDLWGEGDGEPSIERYARPSEEWR